MKNNHNVALHFFDSHITYFTAWCNDAKSYKSYLQSVWNPDLQDATVPQISNALQVRCRKRKTKNTVFVNINKKEKLTNKIVSEIISYKNIKNKTELYALAQTQKYEGKDDLLTFLISKTSKKIEELICATRGITNSLSEMKRSESQQRSFAPCGRCLHSLFYKSNSLSKKISSWSLFCSVLFCFVLRLTLIHMINQVTKCH